MDRREALTELRSLYDRRDSLHSDAEGRAWLERVAELLRRLAPGQAREFDNLAPLCLAGLSEHTVRPLWHRIGAVVQAGIVSAEGELDDSLNLERAVALLKGGLEGNRKFNALRWRGGPTLVLEGADLSGVELPPYMNLAGVILRRVSLRGASLRAADLRGANLYEADLRQCLLFEANLTHANLARADLRGASLYGAHLVETGLSGTNLEGTVLGYTVIASDLSTAVGLDKAVHQAPSIVSVDAILGSGPLPEKFLRGCGLRDEDIRHFNRDSSAAVTASSCFICYATADEELATKLYDDLQAADIRCWKWNVDGRVGRPLWAEITGAIRSHDRLLLIASRSSLMSPAVGREIERALQLEDERLAAGRDGDVLFPIRTDDYVLSGWEHERKADVTKKIIADAREWRDADKYTQLLRRVTRDLTA